MRRRRCLILGIYLQDRRARNDVLIREVRGGFGEHHVDLAGGGGGDGIDLVVLVAGGDADFDWELNWQGKKVVISIGHLQIGEQLWGDKEKYLPSTSQRRRRRRWECQR